MCLLLDVGSTFIKYAFYEEKNKQVLHFDKYPFPEGNKHGENRFSVPLPKINEAIFNIFNKAKEKGCTKAYICVQMHGYVLCTEDGSFGDYISWRDNSGDITSSEIKAIDFRFSHLIYKK